MGTNGLLNCLITYEYILLYASLHILTNSPVFAPLTFSLPRIRLLPTLIAFCKLLLPQQEV